MPIVQQNVQYKCMTEQNGFSSQGVKGLSNILTVVHTDALRS